jgi:hypothetical protein
MTGMTGYAVYARDIFYPIFDMPQDPLCVTATATQTTGGISLKRGPLRNSELQ